MTLGIEQAVREAVYVIEEVKKVDLWCGGPTQLICIKQSGDEYVLEKKKPREIAKIATEMSDLDQDIKREQSLLFSPSGPRSPRRNKPGRATDV